MTVPTMMATPITATWNSSRLNLRKAAPSPRRPAVAARITAVVTSSVASRPSRFDRPLQAWNAMNSLNDSKSPMSPSLASTAASPLSSAWANSGANAARATAEGISSTSPHARVDSGLPNASRKGAATASPMENPRLMPSPPPATNIPAGDRPRPERRV